MATLHIHLDESGDWTFGPKGSRYFVITSAWSYDPKPLADALTALRYSLVRSGMNIQGFHASHDKQATRNAVVTTMMAHEDWAFASVVLEKRKINPSIRDPARFYPTFAGALLRFILRGRLRTGTGKVLVYADTLPMTSNAQREGALKAIHTTCADNLWAGCGYHAFSHKHESNCWIQVADYCCWAIQRKWEHNNILTYNQIRGRMASSELDLTARGDGTTYY